jgi:Ca2+-binding RTX toxin-like protein
MKLIICQSVLLPIWWSDEMLGGQDNDTLIGENGNDEMSGDNGGHVMSGGDDSDDMNGGQGNDTVIGDGGIKKIRIVRFITRLLRLLHLIV